MKHALLAGALVAWCGLALAQDHVPPHAVTNLSVSTGTTNAVISWSAPGDQCTNAACAEYELRFSGKPFTECNFSSGTRLSTARPQPPGKQECVALVGLTCNATYYFAVRAKDDAGNWSVLSNVVSQATAPCNTSKVALCE